MDNTLIDRETLGQFVDELIKKKPLPTENPEEINTLREKSITALDDKIGTAIFSQFTQEQNIEFNRMLNLEEEPSEDTYKAFFDKCGIDLEKTIINTMQSFATEFLGGQNVQ